MHLIKFISKLKEDKLSNKEYQSLRRQCLRLVKKACKRYRVQDISLNSSIRQDTFDSIYIKSLLKTLKGYDSNKGSVSTYFFYKACSAARVEAGKLKRRMHVCNTYSLKESFYNKSV